MGGRWLARPHVTRDADAATPYRRRMAACLRARATGMVRQAVARSCLGKGKGKTGHRSRDNLYRRNVQRDAEGVPRTALRQRHPPRADLRAHHPAAGRTRMGKHPTDAQA